MKIHCTLHINVWEQEDLKNESKFAVNQQLVINDSEGKFTGTIIKSAQSGEILEVEALGTGECDENYQVSLLESNRLYWLNLGTKMYLTKDITQVDGRFGRAANMELYQDRIRRYHSKFLSKEPSQGWTKFKLTRRGNSMLEKWLKGITDINPTQYCFNPQKGLVKNGLEYVIEFIKHDWNRIDPKDSVLEDWANWSTERPGESNIPTPRKETFPDFLRYLDDNFFEIDDQLERQRERYKAYPTPENKARLARYERDLTRRP